MLQIVSITIEKSFLVYLSSVNAVPTLEISTVTILCFSRRETPKKNDGAIP
jgi:hypothetical protein